MSTFHEHRLLRKTIQDLNALRLKGNKKEKPQQDPLVLPGVNATSTMKSSRPTGSIIGLTKPTVTNLPGRTPGGSTIIGRSPRAMQQNAARQQNIYQANLAKNAATVSSGLKPQTSQYINIETPGGTIGYDAAQYKPVVDENGVTTGVTQNTEAVQPTQPTNPVRTLVDRGMFKPSETNPTKLVLDESKVASKVEERRNQRLIDMGIDPNSEVVKLIEQGGKYDGTDAIGSTPYIRMPDGTRVAVEGYSGEKIQTLSNNKDQFDTATIKKEVKDEFKDTYTGTDSSIGGTSQGTQATTTDTTGMSGTSTSLATQAGLGQKYDLTPFQTTQSSIADLQSQIKNLSPDLQAAVLPSLMALQASSDLSMKTAAALISNLPTDQEITAGYGTLENYILDQDTKYKDIIEKNKQQSLAVANYNRDALELEKKLNDHNAYVAEQQQAQKNIDTEKGLRRQLNKLGIQTDTSGLDYLNTQLQRGVDALNNLKTANSLVSLRAQLAIGEGYKLDVKNALNTYEANYLQISSQTAEALRSVKKDIAMRIDDRDKEIRSILEKAVEKKSKNDADAADKIYQANLKMMEFESEKRKKDMEGIMTDGDALEFSTKIEASVNGLQEVKNFKETTFFYNGMQAAAATYTADPSTKGAFDTALVKLYEKILDPTSVVRQEEFESQLRSQGIVRGSIQKAIDSFNGGQGLDPKMQKAMLDMAGSLYDSAKSTTLGAIQPKLAQVKRFNSMNGANVSLDEVLTPDVISALDIPVDEYDALDAELGIGPDEILPSSQGTDFGTDFSSWMSSVGNGTVIQGSPYHTGIDQFAIDIDGEIGNPIPAFAGGTVTSISTNRKSGYGVSVVIMDDEGNEHLYGHLNTTNLKQGQKVQPGQSIGEIGATGNVIAGKGNNGSHLHYRITKGGVAVRPSGNFQVASATGTPSEVGGAPQAQPAPSSQPVSSKLVVPTTSQSNYPMLNVGSYKPDMANAPSGYITYKTKDGGIIQVHSSQTSQIAKYDSLPDSFTRIN